MHHQSIFAGHHPPEAPVAETKSAATTPAEKIITAVSTGLAITADGFPFKVGLDSLDADVLGFIPSSSAASKAITALFAAQSAAYNAPPTAAGVQEINRAIEHKELPAEWKNLSSNQKMAAAGTSLILNGWNAVTDGLAAIYFFKDYMPMWASYWLGSLTVMANIPTEFLENFKAICSGVEKISGKNTPATAETVQKTLVTALKKLPQKNNSRQSSTSSTESPESIGDDRTPSPVSEDSIESLPDSDIMSIQSGFVTLSEEEIAEAKADESSSCSLAFIAKKTVHVIFQSLKWAVIGASSAEDGAEAYIFMATLYGVTAPAWQWALLAACTVNLFNDLCFNGCNTSKTVDEFIAKMNDFLHKTKDLKDLQNVICLLVSAFTAAIVGHSKQGLVTKLLTDAPLPFVLGSSVRKAISICSAIPLGINFAAGFHSFMNKTVDRAVSHLTYQEQAVTVTFGDESSALEKLVERDDKEVVLLTKEEDSFVCVDRDEADISFEDAELVTPEESPRELSRAGTSTVVFLPGWMNLFRRNNSPTRLSTQQPSINSAPGVRK